MAELTHLPADAPAGAIAAVLDRDGALILDAVVAPDLLAALKAELAPYVEATPVGADGFTGERKRGDIGFATLRGGTVIGDHSVIFAGPLETITLSHHAQEKNTAVRGRTLTVM